MRSIISKIRSIKGVIRTEAYQPVRIKWYKEWLKKEDNGQDYFGPAKDFLFYLNLMNTNASRRNKKGILVLMDV